MSTSYFVRSVYIQCMIRSALAARIIPRLNTIRKVIVVLSYFAGSVDVFRFLETHAVSYGTIPVVFASLGVNPQLTGRPKKPSKEDYEKDYGGSGSRVVGYVRVSSSDQKKGLSPEVQEEELLGWVKDQNPSYLYMKFDNGKTGTDFTRRKIKDISNLQEEGKVNEVWVRHVDRLGRECFELAYFFTGFLLKGGVIRTSDMVYTRDLTSFIMFIAQAFSAHVSNTARAQSAMASIKKSFQLGNWLRRSPPFGYKLKSDGKWIEKEPTEERAVLDIFREFLGSGDIESVRRYMLDKDKIDLKRDRIRGILSNEVYIGRPSLLGEVKCDPSLAYVQEGEYFQIQSKLAETHSRYEKKADATFRELFFQDAYSLSELLVKLHQHFLKCGGFVGTNGTHPESKQITFRCNKCLMQFRFPLLRRPKNSEQSSPLADYDRSAGPDAVSQHGSNGGTKNLELKPEPVTSDTPQLGFDNGKKPRKTPSSVRYSDSFNHCKGQTKLSSFE